MLLFFGLERYLAIVHGVLVLLMLLLSLMNSQRDLWLRTQVFQLLLLNEKKLSLFFRGLLDRNMIITFGGLASEDMVNIFLNVVLLHTQIFTSRKGPINVGILHHR